MVYYIKRTYAMSTPFPNISAFPVLAELSEDFPKSRIYLVGGAVRDFLLDKKVTDLDIVIQGVAGTNLEEFLATRGRVVFAGKHFGVWKFHEIGKPKEEVYDIALPRTEFSLHRHGAYRDFSVQTDPNLPIEEDLKRRDFTINAMAYDLKNEELIDPNNGQDDLKNRIIRTVGAPEERFHEDYSRLLRAMRFSLQLDFALEQETRDVTRSMMVNVNNEADGRRVLPYEVIAEEFLKSFAAHPAAALGLWDELGALAELVPELLRMKNCMQPEHYHSEGDVWMHTRLALEQLSGGEFQKEFPNEKPDLELIMATLFHDIGKPYTITTPEADGSDRIRFNNHDQIGANMTKTILERMRIGSPADINIKTDHIVWLVRYHMIGVHGDPDAMRPVTVEKYFFNQYQPSRNLLKLIYADSMATLNAGGNPITDVYEKLRGRIGEIKRITGSHGNRLVKPLLSGKDVMEVLSITEGPTIGIILNDVRQKQLSGELTSAEDARSFIMSHAKDYERDN